MRNMAHIWRDKNKIWQCICIIGSKLFEGNDMFLAPFLVQADGIEVDKRIMLLQVIGLILASQAGRVF